MTHPAAELPRRTLRLEVFIVLAVTFGLSAVTAGLQLVDSGLRTLSKQKIPLIPRRSYFDLVDLGLNLASIAELLAWGALGLYLLARSGIGPRDIGLARPRWRPDVLGGAFHLDPGFGAGLGNFVMGVVFGIVWRRSGRLWPLIVAHGLIDTVAFVGYALLAGHLGWLP